MSIPVSVEDIKECMRRAGLPRESVDAASPDGPVMDQNSESIYFPTLCLALEERYHIELDMGQFAEQCRSSIKDLAAHITQEIERNNS